MGKKKIKPKASDSGEDSLSTESIDKNQEEQEDTNKEKLVNKPSTKYSLERRPAVTNPGRRPALSSTSGSYQLKAASIPSGPPGSLGGSTDPRKKKIKPKASDSGEDSLSTESIDENQ